MKYSKLLFFFALTVLLAFSSCKKEELSEMTETTNDVEVTTRTHNALVGQMQASTTNSDGLDLGCFSINFPFDLDVDGEIVTISAVEDFEDALFQDAVFIDFVYPITITYPEDGTTTEIADGEALGDVFAICVPDSGWNEDLFPVFLINDMNSCYTLSYPLNLVDGQGEAYVAEDEDDLVDLVANNPELYFEFPLSLIDEDGNTQTAENEEGLFNLLMLCDDVISNPGGPTDTIDCWGGFNPFGDCFDFVYPFNVVDLNGNSVAIADEDGFINGLFNGTFVDFVYPLTIIDQDGNEVVVNSDVELQAVFDDCFDNSGGNGGGGTPGDEVPLIVFIAEANSGQECYSLVYPINYADPFAGTSGTIEDEQEMMDYFNSGGGNGIDVVVFPVTITATATGEEIVLQSAEDYIAILEDCY